MSGLAKLGIDFASLGFYLVNFGLIFFVVQRFVYRPLVRFLDERRDNIHRNLTEAEALRQQFEKELAQREEEYDRLLKEARAEGQRAKVEAEKLSRILLAEAEAERDRLIAEARGQAEALRRQALEGLDEEVVAKLAELVSAALKRERSAEAAAASIKAAWRELNSK